MYIYIYIYLKIHIHRLLKKNSPLSDLFLCVDSVSDILPSLKNATNPTQCFPQGTSQWVFKSIRFCSFSRSAFSPQFGPGIHGINWTTIIATDPLKKIQHINEMMSICICVNICCIHIIHSFNFEIWRKGWILMNSIIPYRRYWWKIASLRHISGLFSSTSSLEPHRSISPRGSSLERASFWRRLAQQPVIFFGGGGKGGRVGQSKRLGSWKCFEGLGGVSSTETFELAGLYVCALHPVKMVAKRVFPGTKYRLQNSWTNETQTRKQVHHIPPNHGSRLEHHRLKVTANGRGYVIISRRGPIKLVKSSLGDSPQVLDKIIPKDSLSKSKWRSSHILTCTNLPISQLCHVFFEPN